MKEMTPAAVEWATLTIERSGDWPVNRGSIVNEGSPRTTLREERKSCAGGCRVTIGSRAYWKYRADARA